MAEANYIEEDSEMDLLVPIVEKPAAPATPRILNKEFNSNSITATNNNINIVNGNNKFENIVTHFFEITYLPDDPSEKVRKGKTKFTTENTILFRKLHNFGFIYYRNRQEKHHHQNEA